MSSTRKDVFMPSSEAERFALHQTLRGLMPEAVADTLMSHLPPTGWSDIARKADIDAQNLRLDRIEARLDQKFAEIDARFDRIDQKFAEIDARFDRIDQKFAEIDARFNRVDAQFDRIDARFDRIDARFDELASMKRYVVTTGIALAAIICGVGAPLWLSML